MSIRLPSMLKGHRNSSVGLVTTYVDDILVAGRHSIIKAFFKALGNIYDTTEPEYMIPGRRSHIRYLGMEIDMFETGHVIIHQDRYIEDVLKKFGLDECRPAATTGDPKVDIPDLTKETESADSRDEAIFSLCQSMLGSLLFLSTRTRIDIAYAVSITASTLSRDCRQCHRMCKHLFRYLAGTRDYGLVLEPFESGIPPFESYSDASYAPTNNYSHDGLVIMWGGVPLVWRSKRQTIVSTSTAEAELLALATVLNYSLGFQNILYSVQLDLESNLFCDNRAALQNAREGCSWRSRHYLIKAAALRDYYKKGLVSLSYVDTNHNVADLLTRHLPRQKLQYFLDIMNIRRLRMFT